MSFTAEHLTRRALALNAQRAVAEEEALHNMNQFAAEQAAARERVAGYLGTFIEWARASGYKPLPLYIALDDFIKPPAPDMLHIMHDRGRFQEPNYTKWLHDGEAYLFDHSYTGTSGGGHSSGSIVTTDLRCYSAMPRRLDGVWRGEHYSLDAFVRSEPDERGYSANELDPAWFESTIETHLEQTAAGYMYGDQPYAVHRR